MLRRLGCSSSIEKLRSGPSGAVEADCKALQALRPAVDPNFCEGWARSPKAEMGSGGGLSLDPTGARPTEFLS